MRLNYDALDQKSNAFARGFSKIGVKKGDRVAVSLGNNIEYAIVRKLKPQVEGWKYMADDLKRRPMVSSSLGLFW